MASIIISYRDDTDYYFLDEDKSEDNGILGDLIYRTIISLIYTCYLNICELIKKLPDSLEICFFDWKYNR